MDDKLMLTSGQRLRSGLIIFFLLGTARAVADPWELSPATWELKEVTRGQPWETRVQVRNLSSATLHLEPPRTTCDFLTAQLDSSRLPPGGVANLRVHIDSSAAPSQFRCTVFISTVSPPLTQTLDVVGLFSEPNLQLNSEGWQVPWPPEQEGLETTIELSNLGPGPLHFQGVSSSDPRLQAEITPTLVPPRGKAILHLRLDTRNLTPPFSFTVPILSNDPLEPRRVLKVVSKKSNRLRVSFPSASGAPVGPVRLRFFYAPGCGSCRRLQEDFLPQIRQRYGDLVRIEEYDITNRRNYQKLLRLEGAYEKWSRAPARIFLGNTCLAGEEEIRERLEEVIERNLRTPTWEPDTGRLATLVQWRPWVPTPEDEELLRSRFQSFTIFAVALAGLIDGVNPCALTTLVFLISFLAYAGRQPRELWGIGLVFTAVTFLTYLGLGIGLFGALQSLAVYYHLARVVNWTAGLLALGVAGVQLYDLNVARRGVSTRAWKGQLPQQVKRYIHAIVRTHMGPGKMLWGVGTAAFLVTLFEAVCTGQVYLPTIVLVLQDATLQARAAGYLLLYNLLFVTPLVVVFVLAAGGLRSEVLRAWAQRHVVGLKILLALLMLLLAGLLLLPRSMYSLWCLGVHS